MNSAAGQPHQIFNSFFKKDFVKRIQLLILIENLMRLPWISYGIFREEYTILTAENAEEGMIEAGL